MKTKEAAITAIQASLTILVVFGLIALIVTSTVYIVILFAQGHFLYGVLAGVIWIWILLFFHFLSTP